MKNIQSSKRIAFTQHAQDKLARLQKVGITRAKVLTNVKNPGKIVKGYMGRKIVQCKLTEELLKRIVYEEILIITIYPCERRRYESQI